MKAVFARPGTVIPGHRRSAQNRHHPRRGIARHAVFGARAAAVATIMTASSNCRPTPVTGAPAARGARPQRSGDRRLASRPIAAMRPASTALRAISRPPAWARSRAATVAPVPGKFPSPKNDHTRLRAPSSETACPMFAGRLIRGVKNGPSPAMAAGPAESRRPAADLRAGRCDQSDLA